MLPKINVYVKSCDGQYNTIWYNVSANIKKEFDSEHAYNKKFLKTKMLSYGYRFSL